MTDTGATVGAGAPVVTLLEQQNPRVRVGLPVVIALDETAAFSVVVNGVTHSASLDVLRPHICPQPEPTRHRLNFMARRRYPLVKLQ